MHDEATFNKIIDKVHNARTLLRFTKELSNINCLYSGSSHAHLKINGLIAGYEKDIYINLLDYILLIENYLDNLDNTDDEVLFWRSIRSSVAYNQDIFIHWRNILLDKDKTSSRWSDKSFVKELLSIIDHYCPRNIEFNLEYYEME